MQTTYPEPNLSLAHTGAGLDRFGRIVNHGWLQGETPLVHVLHGYDFAGNRTFRYDTVHAANSELYEYDGVNQIKSLDRGILSTNNDSVTTTNHTESWSFDKTGNWQQYDKNGATETRTHNKANELQGIATHDANGNMTLMPGLKGKYDAWNRLVEVRDANDNFIARYEYNALNQRIKKTVGTTTTHHFYNENWQELESQSEHEASASVYVWGLRYIDDLIYREKGEERLYALQDPNWNVTATTDATGEVKERYKYDAFGKQTILDEDFTEKPVSTFLWNRTFTGQVYDFETGLMLYRNRFYHTELGRFVNRDPIEYESKDINLYRYVGNRTLVYLDSQGKQETNPWQETLPTNPDGTVQCVKPEPWTPLGMQGNIDPNTLSVISNGNILIDPNLPSTAHVTFDDAGNTQWCHGGQGCQHDIMQFAPPGWITPPSTSSPKWKSPSCQAALRDFFLSCGLGLPATVGGFYVAPSYPTLLAVGATGGACGLAVQRVRNRCF